MAIHFGSSNISSRTFWSSGILKKARQSTIWPAQCITCTRTTAKFFCQIRGNQPTDRVESADHSSTPESISATRVRSITKGEVKILPKHYSYIRMLRNERNTYRISWQPKIFIYFNWKNWWTRYIAKKRRKWYSKLVANDEFSLGSFLFERHILDYWRLQPRARKAFYASSELHH